MGGWYDTAVSVLYVLYYVPLVVAYIFVLTSDDDAVTIPTPYSPTCTQVGSVSCNSDANWRIQFANVVVIVVAVFHLILGYFYGSESEEDKSLRREGLTVWYLKTRGITGIIADVLIAASLVFGIIGVGDPPTSGVGLDCEGPIQGTNSVSYCGGMGVWVTLTALSLAAGGNLFCIASQLASRCRSPVGAAIEI